MKKISIFAVLLVVAVVLSGCESMGANTKKGAGIGGLVGAVAGGVIGHQMGHGVEGALIGGAVGALGGGTIGSGIDDEKNKTNPQSSTSHVSIMNIVEMTEQGIPADVIIDQLKTSGSTYSIDSSTVQFLEDKGVNQKVIAYMVSGS